MTLRVSRVRPECSGTSPRCVGCAVRAPSLTSSGARPALPAPRTTSPSASAVGAVGRAETASGETESIVSVILEIKSHRLSKFVGLFKKYQLSSINRGWQPPSKTSPPGRYRPQQLTTTTTTAAPSTTTPRSKSSSHSRAHYKGGLTHYNSWLAEPAHQRSSLKSSSPAHRRQRQARRFRKHSRRH